MRTEDLITTLARQAGPAPRAAVRRRLGLALLGGLALALGLGGMQAGSPLPLPTGEPAFWLKLGYTALLAGLALAWLQRLGQPGLAAGPGPRLMALAVLAMAGLGLLSLAALPAGARLGTVWGGDVWACPRNVLGLALPVFALVAWALRGLAPTRLRRAGLAAGLAAGAAGAFAYAFSCPELAPAFVAVWYSASIAVAGLLGALVGPWLLRW